MTRILQGNLGGRKGAAGLLSQMLMEHRIDIMLACEQYGRPDGNGWLVDNTDYAAIWTNPRTVTVEDRGTGNGYVWVRTEEATYVSCYLSPNDVMPVFRAKLARLENIVSQLGNTVLLAGDFNARATEWGMPTTNSKGRAIIEMAARRGLVVLNLGNVTTYRKEGGLGESIPDVTFATDGLAGRVSGWHVLDQETASDHQYIRFNVSRDGTRRRETITSRPRWMISKMDEDKLVAAIEGGRRAVTEAKNAPCEGSRAEIVVDVAMRLLEQACAESMPLKRNKEKRATYWWTQQIDDKRRECQKTRRLMKKEFRKKNKPAARALAAEHKALRKEMEVLIQASKKRCWDELREEVDRDPWGMGYHIVTKRLGAMTKGPPMDEEKMESIVDALFPTHRVVEWQREHVPVEEIPLFTERELQIAASSMRNRKAPGPDGIPAEVLKVVARRHPELLLDVYNQCLMEGVFCKRWKEALLALISKGKGPADSPSSYRPLCMLDNNGKLLERLLKPRLLNAIQDGGNLSPHQHGFRKRKSAVGAVSEVVDATTRVFSGPQRSRQIGILAAIDVRNAFNTMGWENAMNALKSFGIPAYLQNILGDYLKDRSLRYDTAEGERTKKVTAGAAQGSVLGPDLWNIAYDSLLRLPMPRGARLIAYADDVGILIIARTRERAQEILKEVMFLINRWMKEHGLDLALHKTEVILLTRKRIDTILPVDVGGQETITTTSSLKYLGVTIDSKLNFWQHICRVSEKALNVTMSLSRLMANVGGPVPSRRKLLMTTVESILLYGAEVWADALRKKTYRKKMEQVHRKGALRITSAYRTTSQDAALVIAGVIPIDLLAQERKLVYQSRSELGTERAKSEARDRSLEAWQTRWQESDKGRWTARLIPLIAPWLQRKHGEVNYFLTQMLTGHGLFSAYLHRMGIAASPMCRHCGADVDGPEHTFFACPRWSEERRVAEEIAGELTPENVTETMLESQAKWIAIAGYAERLLRRKKEEEVEMDRREAEAGALPETDPEDLEIYLAAQGSVDEDEEDTDLHPEDDDNDDQEDEDDENLA